MIDLRPFTFVTRERERIKAERKAARAAAKQEKATQPASPGGVKRLHDESGESDDDDSDYNDEDELLEDFEEEEGTYELFGVVCHVGRADGGHYTAYIRSGKSWYFCNDDQVSQVPVSTVLKSQAYILFYSKKRLCYQEVEGGLTELSDLPSSSLPLSSSLRSSSKPTDSGISSGTFSHLDMIIPPRSPHL